MMRISCLMLFIVGAISAPADDPVHIDLPVYDQPKSASSITFVEPLEPENHPGSGVSLSYTKEKTFTNILNHKINSSPPIGSVNYGNVLSPPVTKLDGALLEIEGTGSKVLSVNENLQGAVAGIFQPKPIVDTITEEEKYGNTGDKFQSTGRAIVNGAEGFSNFVNSILEVPSKIFRSITRAASEKLNQLGGKIVGLQK